MKELIRIIHDEHHSMSSVLHALALLTLARSLGFEVDATASHSDALYGSLKLSDAIK